MTERMERVLLVVRISNPIHFVGERLDWMEEFLFPEEIYRKRTLVLFSQVGAVSETLKLLKKPYAWEVYSRWQSLYSYLMVGGYNNGDLTRQRAYVDFALFVNLIDDGTPSYGWALNETTQERCILRALLLATRGNTLFMDWGFPDGEDPSLTFEDLKRRYCLSQFLYGEIAARIQKEAGEVRGPMVPFILLYKHFIRPAIHANELALPEEHLVRIHLAIDRKLFTKYELFKACCNSYFQLFFAEDYFSVDYHKSFYFREPQLFLLKTYSDLRTWFVNGTWIQLMLDFMAVLFGALVFAILTAIIPCLILSESNQNCLLIDDTMLKRFAIWYFLKMIIHFYQHGLAGHAQNNRTLWITHFKHFTTFGYRASIFDLVEQFFESKYLHVVKLVYGLLDSYHFEFYLILLLLVLLVEFKRRSHEFDKTANVLTTNENNIEIRIGYTSERKQVTLRRLPLNKISSSLGLVEVEAYCQKKLSSYLPFLKGKPIIIIGCSQGIIWDMAQEALKHQLKLEVNQTSENIANYRPLKKPSLFFGQLDGREVVVLRTPAGLSHTDLYMKAILSMKNLQLLAAYIVSEIYEDLSVFEFAYEINHYELRNVARDSIIILGVSSDSYYLQTFQQDGDIVVERCEGKNWKAWVCRSKASNIRMCFFEWMPSFSGEISYQLATCLLIHGAREILHVGCKVAILANPNDMRKVITPASFVIANQQGIVSVERIANCLLSPTFESGTHLSMMNPFMETHEVIRFINNLTGMTSIDNEGAYFAKAVIDFNNRMQQERSFGAIYFGSDFVFKEHEEALFLGNACLHDKISEREKKSIQYNISNILHMHYQKRWYMVEPTRTSLINQLSSSNPYRIAKEKYDEFEEGTREWLVEEIIERTKTNKAIFLLAGAGMGKSTLFGSMAMRFCEEMAQAYGKKIVDKSLSIVAVHFFRYNANERSFMTALKSISSQLCQSIPGFAKFLARDEEQINKHLDEGGNGEFSMWLNKLILDPARGLTDNGEHPSPKKLAVILDALDECEDSIGFTSAIYESWCQAPDWLVLIVSSRPQIPKKIGVKSEQIYELTPTDTDNEQDLRLFIMQRILRKFNVADDVIIDNLVVKSEGVFLWLFLQEGELIKIFFNSTTASRRHILRLPQGLWETYKYKFQRLYDALRERYPDPTHLQEVYVKAISIGLVLPREPIPESLWKLCLGYDENTNNIKVAFSNLLIFSEDGTLQPPHKSMIDWLCEKDAPSASTMEQFHLAIDVSSQNKNHLTLAEMLQQQLLKIPANSSYKVFVKDPLTSDEQYACAHYIFHACRSGDFDRLKFDLLNFLHLFWITYSAKCSNNFSRLIHDLVEVETNLNSCLYFITQLFTIGQEALRDDPRQLAAQVLGRISSNNLLKEILTHSCRTWLQNKPESLTCYIPRNICTSGLERSDSSLIFQGHASKVYSICLSNDGKTLFTCSADKTARSWNVQTGKQIHVFEGHTSSVNSICLSNDDKTLFTCSFDKTIRSWNVETGQHIQVFEGHTSRIMSMCLSNDGKTLFTCSDDETARSWNVQTGKQIHVFKGHISSVNSICLSNDGGTLFTCSRDTTARSWNVITGKQIYCFQGHTSFESICLSNDGKTLFACSEDGTVRSWNVETGKQIHSLKGHANSVNSICLSKDDKTLFTCSFDKTIRSWNVETGQHIQVFEGHTSEVNSICLSNDGKTLFAGSRDRTARSWVVETGEQIQLFEGHTESVNSICLSNDGKSLFTCSEDGRARSWVLEAGQQRHTSRINSICLSTDGKSLYSCSRDRIVRSWNVETGQGIHLFEGHTSCVNSACLSNDGKILFTCSNDWTGRSWNIETGKQIHIFKGHSDYVTSICLSNDGETLFTCSHDKTARSWNVETGSQLHVFEGHTSRIMSMCLSNDGKTLFTCSNDETARSWIVETGLQIHVFKGHASSVESISLSNDGKTLFSCSADKTARSWNVETGKQIHIFEGHTSKVESICLSNDGETLFTCSYDFTACSWNVETGQQIHVFEGHTKEINSICLSDDGSTLITIGKDCVRYWDVSTGLRKDQNMEQLTRNSRINNVLSSRELIGTNLPKDSTLYHRSGLIYGFSKNDVIIWHKYLSFIIQD